MIKQEQFEVLLKALRKVEKRLDLVEEAVGRVDRDLADDRKSLDNFSLKLGQVEESNKAIRDSLTRFQQKTSDAIKDAVATEVAPVKEQMDEFVEKKVIRTPVPKESKMVAWMKKKIRQWQS